MGVPRDEKEQTDSERPGSFLAAVSPLGGQKALCCRIGI